jgi:hypothetical protein
MQQKHQMQVVFFVCTLHVSSHSGILDVKGIGLRAKTIKLAPVVR